MLFLHLILLFSLWCVTMAFPATLRTRELSVTPAIIRAISPASSSCTGAPHPLECRTAEQAASPIQASFYQYSILTAGEAAAIVSLMAFESGDFKYQNNYVPGNPGQGSKWFQTHDS
ncbi:MAG: hypothetical protein ACRYGG_22335 [Janthinobacterium lividum]